MSSETEKLTDIYVQPLYVCVHCGEPNQKLIRIYAESALLIQTCPKCNEPVDKYIEYDFTPIFIDILLLKLTAFRHVLFNTTNKTFLPRLVGLTILSTSYVQWVFERQHPDTSSLPVFYELEWGYYTVILNQSLSALTFAFTLLLCGFLVSLSAHKSKFPFHYTLEGVAIGYCWNLVSLPSLVWNHYSMYSSLSYIAMLISCNHTFLVTIRNSYLFSVPSVAISYLVQWSTIEWMNSFFRLT